MTKPTLLLSTGDEILGECLQSLLAPQYQVVLPQRSDSLLREAEIIQPHIIVLDDSLDAAHDTLCLSLSRRLPDSPLIYLSNRWQASLVAKLQAHGVHTVLRKPFPPATLLATLRQLSEATPC